MNKEKYKKARNFAFLIGGPDTNPLDLVHDCYVKWFEKHGSDFLEETPTLMYKVMRNHYISELRHGRQFTWRGITDNRELFNLNDTHESGEPKFELTARVATDELAIVNDLKDAFTKRIAQIDNHQKRLSAVFEIVSKGHDYKQVQKDLGLGRSMASTYIKTMRDGLAPLVGKQVLV